MRQFHFKQLAFFQRKQVFTSFRFTGAKEKLLRAETLEKYRLHSADETNFEYCSGAIFKSLPYSIKAVKFFKNYWNVLVLQTFKSNELIEEIRNL
jgi:hypothetical protein